MKILQSVVQAESTGTAASERKTAKYSNLSSSHVFNPVAAETFGAPADNVHVFLAEIDSRATLCKADPLETTSCISIFQ